MKCSDVPIATWYDVINRGLAHSNAQPANLLTLLASVLSALLGREEERGLRAAGEGDRSMCTVNCSLGGTNEGGCSSWMGWNRQLKDTPAFLGCGMSSKKWLFQQKTMRTGGLQNAQGVDTLVCLPVELKFLFWNKSFRKQRPVIWQQT